MQLQWDSFHLQKREIETCFHSSEGKIDIPFISFCGITSKYRQIWRPN